MRVRRADDAKDLARGEHELVARGGRRERSWLGCVGQLDEAKRSGDGIEREATPSLVDARGVEVVVPGELQHAQARGALRGEHRARLLEAPARKEE